MFIRNSLGNKACQKICDCHHIIPNKKENNLFGENAKGEAAVQAVAAVKTGKTSLKTKELY